VVFGVAFGFQVRRTPHNWQGAMDCSRACEGGRFCGQVQPASLTTGRQHAGQQADNGQESTDFFIKQHGGIVVTDPEFLNHAEATLRAIEACCDRINDECDVDLDNQRTGNMVTLVFAQRSQIVINLQKPLHEIWMAAKSGGYHFQWVDGVWQDTKGQGDFFALLTANASTQSGQHLLFQDVLSP
jgi:CyaY protein